MCFGKYFCCFSRNKKENLLSSDFEKYRHNPNEYIYDDNYYDVMDNWKFFSTNQSS